jgi:uncharacterized protein involved in response to NO
VKRTRLSSIALLSLGFRPFFLAAGSYAVFAMSLWFAAYAFGLQADVSGLPATLWHAHEMVYGYTLAVIAGFLLTAVSNWTGLQTLRGIPLLTLLLCWLAARAAFYVPGLGMLWSAAFDTLFCLYLLIAIAVPIARKRQWQQSGIVAKLVLIGAGNLVFYLGVLGYLDQGVRWGLYTGFYLVIGLILTMSRRLIPFFIERGLDTPVQLRNSSRVDTASLVVYLVFFVVEVFVANRVLAAGLAGVLFLVHAYRLAGWHTPGIWHKPLLWSLYLSYAFITGGFLLFAASQWLHSLWFPALHAFAVGGIGLVTLSMMTRVSLGHTGRSIHEPPRLMPLFLLLLICAALVRVVLPPLLPDFYRHWIALSQLLWISAFAGFVAVYLPILTRASRP